jgi:hypothetical protein
LSHLYIEKTNILPRQARDKHRESTQKKDRFFPQEVEGLKQLMTEGYVQILPQAPGSRADDDGGYTRRVREMTTLSNSSSRLDGGGDEDDTAGYSGEGPEEGLTPGGGGGGQGRVAYRRRHGYLFPQWWFLVIAAPSVLPGANNASFSQLFLCLSRACLGRMIVLM